MILNRKSAKKTSKVSLFVAITMLTTFFVLLYCQDYQVEYIAENGVSSCSLSAVDILISIFW